MNDHVVKSAELSLLQQSFYLYHSTNYEQIETPRPNTKEKPYNTHKQEHDWKPEMQRLYLRDVFQVGDKNRQVFPYDLVLEFEDGEELLIFIDDTILRSKETRSTYPATHKVTIPTALVSKAIEEGYISRKEQINIDAAITCNISLKSDACTIENVASFAIFKTEMNTRYAFRFAGGKRDFPGTLSIFKDLIPEKIVEYNDDGFPELDGENNPIYKKNLFFGQFNITNKRYPPMAYELDYFYYHTQPTTRHYFYDQKKKGSTIYFKFFDLNQVDPHPDASKRFLPPDYYAFSFIKACDFEGKPYFRLINPNTLSQVSLEKNLEDGTAIRESFFALNTGYLYEDKLSFFDNPDKFYVIMPLDYGDVMGIKTVLRMAGGEHLEVVSALANTNGTSVTVEPKTDLPRHWKDSKGKLKPNIQYDEATGIYTKKDHTRNLIEEYDHIQKLMVTKQVNTSFARIPEAKQGGIIKTTDTYFIEATSNHYCTTVEYRPQPGYVHVTQGYKFQRGDAGRVQKPLEEVTVDMWDCIKHVGQDRLSFIRADEFIVIQYTTAEDVLDKPYEVRHSFKQNTLWVQGEDGKMQYLETGLAHKMSRKQMWGVNNLDELADKPKDYKIPNRLQFHVGHGTDALVIGCVKNGVPDWHMVRVTGKYRAGLDLANY